MNLDQVKLIEQAVDALHSALSEFCCITDDIRLPSLFYNSCGSEAKQLMSEACREIATKDATERIKSIRDKLNSLGVQVSEQDILSRITDIREQRARWIAYREAKTAQALLGSAAQTVN